MLIAFTYIFCKRYSVSSAQLKMNLKLKVGTILKKTNFMSAAI